MYFAEVSQADSTTEVERKFLSSLDQDISSQAIEILASSYRFRSDNIKKLVEDIGNNLSSILPRTIYVYKSKVINSQLESLRNKLLSTDPLQEDQIKQLTLQIQQLSMVKSRLLREAKFAK